MANGFFPFGINRRFFDRARRDLAERGAPSREFDIGRGGERGLRDIALRQFFPELERLRGTREGIEGAFLGQVTEPGALFGAARTAAEGTARELFAPGGEVSSLIGRARGRSVQTGFAPEAAAGSENVILRGATQRVADRFAQEAGALEQARFGGFASFFGQQQQSIQDLLESLFTGVSSAEQLGLAKKSQRRRFLGIF